MLIRQTKTLVFGARRYSQANNDGRGRCESSEDTLIHLVWGQSGKAFWWRQSQKENESGKREGAQWRQTQESGVKPEGIGTEEQGEHEAT